MCICSIKPAISSLKASPQPFKFEKMTIYTHSIFNAYPYFWILWWKVLEERDVFGWLPCTLGKIELFLLVLLCHDFRLFIFCMIFWLRQLSCKHLANQRALLTLRTETGLQRLRLLSSQLLWFGRTENLRLVAYVSQLAIVVVADR